MSGALTRGGFEAADAAPLLPRAQQLAALGTVLCLYRPQHGGELSGWAQASRAESQAGVDSDGLRESLAFFDDNERCCWRLFLLPDSDFLAWDRLLACLPAREEVEPASGVGERLWRKLAGRLLGEQWQACVLKLHVLPSAARQPVLAASLAMLSPLGASTARRIVEAEGADENAVFDDCCCARSALMARNLQAHSAGNGGGEVPLIKFNPREKT
ncbi:MAG TPA: Hemin transport protein [Pseudoxanthomonas sp.]